MLHILWILIKFILIILEILLGLALLAVLLLLFCPVRYQARAVKEAGSFKETEERTPSAKPPGVRQRRGKRNLRKRREYLRRTEQKSQM